MFSQLFRSSLKVGRMIQIKPIKYAANSKFLSLPKSSYATAATKHNAPKSTSLEFIIKDLKGRVKNKSRLSNDDLQSLLMKLKTQKCDSEQALEILRCCSFARLDENLTNIVINIWNELKKQNHDFQTKHYNLLMQYFINRGESKDVQKLFEEMIDAKIQPNALSYQCLLEAHYMADEMDRVTEVLGLMNKAMNSQSMELNENVFEKIIQIAAKKGSTEVLNVVEMMCTDLNIQPQISFVRDYILPALNSKENPNEAFTKLQATKIRQRVAMMAMIANSLNNGDIQTAYECARNNKTFYGIDLIRRPLVNAFKTTKDVPKFVSFVRLINDNFRFIKNYYQNKTFTEAEITVKQKTYVSETLALAIFDHRTDTQLILQLLKSFADEGLNITTEKATSIQKSLQVDEETQIGRLLKKLSSEQSQLQSIQDQRGTPNVVTKLGSVDGNVMEIKQTHGYKQMNPTEKYQFLENIREGNVAEIESLLATDEFIFSNSDYAQLIELYVKFSDLEKAMNMMKRAFGNNAEFKLDCTKVSKLVTLMVEKERDFSEIELVLIKNSQIVTNPRIYAFEILLLRLASRGYVIMVEKLFNAFLKYRYFKATDELTSPLILAHIKNGTLAEAVDKYEYLAKKFKLDSMTKVLLIELGKKKEMDLLQRVQNIYTEIHGIEATLAQSAFAFIECGQERQAREILENNLITNLSQHISKECKEYAINGRLEAARTLLNATKGLNCDRHMIYQTILDIYQKKNKADEALKLWHEYSNEDGISPHQQFQTKLIQLLKSNNMKIPPELQSKQQKEN